MSPARASVKRGGLRGALRTLLAFALLVAVLLPAALGGLSFVWCAPLRQVHRTCCCRAAQAALEQEAANGHRAASSVGAACCEGHRVDSLPPSHGAFEPGAWVPPPPLVRLPPPELPRDRLASIDPCAHPRAHPTRAGPAEPLFALHCRYLN